MRRRVEGHAGSSKPVGLTGVSQIRASVEGPRWLLGIHGMAGNDSLFQGERANCLLAFCPVACFRDSCFL